MEGFPASDVMAIYALAYFAPSFKNLKIVAY
jgi:hypothetical protein